MGKVECRSAVGQLIRCEREKIGLTQRELSDKLGVTRKYISFIEVHNPNLHRGILTKSEIAQKLADALGLDVQKIRSASPHIERWGLPRYCAGIGVLGKFLAHSRLDLNLTRKAVASMAGISKSRLVYLEQSYLNTTKALIDLKKVEKTLGCRVPPDLIPQKLRHLWSRMS